MKSLMKFLTASFLLLLLATLGSFVGQKIAVLWSALTPPVLPDYQQISTAPYRNDQNWSESTSRSFHYKSQGSRTLNIPLSWFLALEAPTGSAIAALWQKQEKFSSAEYLTGFGFIPQPVSQENPNGLPIGFATSPYQQLAGLDGAYTAIGFTCAACHTGQWVFENQRYIIEGGPAVVDLGQLTKSLGAALGQTAISSKVPVLNGRFDRFAKAVLGGQANGQSIDLLRKDLGNLVAALASQPMGIDVTEGFSRLDALNRIGNQVFSTDPGRQENYVNIAAPVNFPPVWTSSWFAWVQYDGSIMSPLVRNMGEAMGTAAHMDFVAPVNQGRFSSTVPVGNLDWIESNLAGPSVPLEGRAFTGLQAPVWPDSFPSLDPQKIAAGEVLYRELCQGCHLPALTRDVATGKAPENEFWDHFKPIGWTDNGKNYQTSRSFLDVPIIPQHEVGTDPGQGRVLAERTVNTSLSGSHENLGIDTRVCTRSGDVLTMVSIQDDPLLSYALALGAAVQLGIDEWAADRFLTDAEVDALKGEQPNCLQAGQGYKARPLNGVWATAPYLHNGSIPTLDHLLGPVENRPAAFELGNALFDPFRVGLLTTEVLPEEKDYNSAGYFVLNTAIPGNSNRGHEFSDAPKGAGVIGRALDDSERAAIIEFLKTL